MTNVKLGLIIFALTMLLVNLVEFRKSGFLEQIVPNKEAWSPKW